MDFDRGHHWRAVWPDGTTEVFDAVVTATGYADPQLHAAGDQVQLVADLGRHGTPPPRTSAKTSA
ncbi:hypothetical protein [Streptomyces sp. NPDC000410]|uniref:hypothetical protein n=1 Tax=Streptomyces sp. NPDC000410 TaxID=3154254 RepID=UPI00331E4BAA